MEKKEVRYKWILYVALMFITALLESTVLSDFRVFGIAPTHLLPYAVATIAMLEGTVSGALAGLFAGVISDAVLPVADGFYTITFTLCGIAVSFLCTLVFWRNFWTSLLYLAATIIICRLLYYIFFFVIFGRAEVLSLFATIPGEFFVSALFSPILYPLILKIARRTGDPLEE